MGKYSTKFKDMVGADNAREKSRGSGYGHLSIPRGLQILQPEGGERLKLDFLPYTVSEPNHPCRDDAHSVAVPGSMWYRRPYKLHRNVGGANESVVCPQSIGKKCPICEYRMKLAKDGKSDEEEIKSLKASDRNLYAVVPIKHKKLEEAVSLLDISRYCFQDILRDETDENPEFRAFFDPSEEGFTLSVRFSKESLGKNSFAMANRIDFEARDYGYDDDWLDKVPDLDKILIILSYAEIERKFFEIETDDITENPFAAETETISEEASDPEPPPSRTRRRRPSESEQEPKSDVKEHVEKECIACGGTGTNSRGLPCRICAKKEPEKTTNPCPSGHEFGADCDKFPKDCAECPIWDQCYDAGA